MLVHLLCKCLLALRKNHALAPCLSPGHKRTPYMRNLTSPRSWGWKVRDQGTGTQWKNSCCAIPLCKAEGQERVRESKGSTGTTVEGFTFQLRARSSVPRSAEILGCYCLDQEATCPDVCRGTQTVITRPENTMPTCGQKYSAVTWGRGGSHCSREVDLENFAVSLNGQSCT